MSMMICGREIAVCIELKCKDEPAAEGMCASHFAKVTKERQGIVYFIAAGQYVKIGYTTNIALRCVDLRAKAGIVLPPDLTLDEVKAHQILATETGGLDREARLHHHFQDYRTAGEWFRRSPELMRYIEAVSRPNYPASRKVISRYDDGLHLLEAAVSAQTAALRAKQDRPSACRARSAAVRAAYEGGIRPKTLARALGIQSQRVLRMAAGRE